LDFFAVIFMAGMLRMMWIVEEGVEGVVDVVVDRVSCGPWFYS
jgi:hypothetical protein